MAKPTTAAMCSPLTDSRCVRPLRRIASASSSPTAFWSPVASAMAIPAELGGQPLRRCGGEGRRAPRRARVGSAGAHDRDCARAPCRPRRCPGTRRRGRNRRCRAAPSAAAAPAGRAAAISRPARNSGAASCPRRSRPAPAAAARHPSARAAGGPSRLAARWSTDSTLPVELARPPAARAAAARPTPSAPRPARSRASRQARTSRAPGPARPLPSTNPIKRERGARCTGTPRHCRGLAEREPGGDAASEADDEPRRKLRALGLEEPFQLLARRGKPRLPIAPSTLWKRRFPYVRGARPLHCSMKRRGKRA